MSAEGEKFCGVKEETKNTAKEVGQGGRGGREEAFQYQRGLKKEKGE